MHELVGHILGAGASWIAETPSIKLASFIKLEKSYRNDGNKRPTSAYFTTQISIVNLLKWRSVYKPHEIWRFSWEFQYLRIFLGFDRLITEN